MYMILDEDVIKIVQATLKANKEVFATKEDFESLRSDFSGTQNSIDGYAKKADTFFQELVASKNRMDRHEEWILKLAKQINVHLDY